MNTKVTTLNKSVDVKQIVLSVQIVYVELF